MWFSDWSNYWGIQLWGTMDIGRGNNAFRCCWTVWIWKLVFISIVFILWHLLLTRNRVYMFGKNVLTNHTKYDTISFIILSWNFWCILQWHQWEPTVFLPMSTFLSFWVFVLLSGILDHTHLLVVTRKDGVASCC
jgi:hypothetical protein